MDPLGQGEPVACTPHVAGLGVCSLRLKGCHQIFPELYSDPSHEDSPSCPVGQDKDERKRFLYAPGRGQLKNLATSNQ